MATRASINIKHGESNIWLYRHWDGYPEETGVDIVEKIEKAVKRKMYSGGDLLKSLLDEKDDEGNERYKLDFEIGGDIEYLYTIEIFREWKGTEEHRLTEIRDHMTLKIENRDGEIEHFRAYEYKAKDEPDDGGRHPQGIPHFAEEMVNKRMAVLGEAEVEGILPFSFTTTVEHEESFLDEPIELTDLEEKLIHEFPDPNDPRGRYKDEDEDE